MSERGENGWRPGDTQAVVEEVSARLTEALGRETADLDRSEVERLRARLVEALPGEAAREARAVLRHFEEQRSRSAKVRAKATARRLHHENSVERLTLHLRVQHMILFASCILLIVTGLPIKFHEAGLSRAIMDLLGGPSVTTFLHRVGAIVLTGIGLYHLCYSGAFEQGRRDFGLLFPKLQDAKDALGQILYFLGWKKEKPLYGRFSYIEKFDYWAVYWGMVVMITSGYILWFKEAAINAFGKFFYDIGREAHSDEALLATLAIVIWHFYNVHFNPKRFPGSLTWWNGKITVEEFKDEHPLEYEEWRADGRLPDDEEEEPTRPAGG